MSYPKVDSWVRSESEEPFVHPDGKNVRIRLQACLPNSVKKFRKEDEYIYDALETFIIERGLFLKKIDIICKYMDYFIEFFDDDKELPDILLAIKKEIDSQGQSLTINEFISLIDRKIFRDTSIKQNIYRMVEANYFIDITVDDKSGRVFNGPNDFTNEEGKRIFAISIMMKFIIPIASQYISTNTIYKKEDMNYLLTKVFSNIFYYMGACKQYETELEEDDELDGADVLMKKLYIFTNDKIAKHHGANPLLWQQQSALRGVTELKHVDEIMIKHLIGNNMFKCCFDANIMKFFKSIVETQLTCTINKVKYKANPSRTDSGKDFNGLTGLDKLDQQLAKLNEGDVIRCDKSLESTVAMIQRDWNIYPTDDEINYYLNNFLMDSSFHMMLLSNFYANIFDGFMEMKDADIFLKCKLLVIFKKRLIDYKYTQLPFLVTSVQVGKSTNRILHNTKLANEYMSSADYQNLKMKKYPALEGLYDDYPDSIVSFILANVFSYVEYENQELTGTDIEFDKQIVWEEMLRFLDSI